MAIVFDGVVPPDALTAFMREVPIPADHLLRQILPDRTIDDLEVSFDELIKKNRAAKFRAFDATVPKSKRDAPTSRRAKLPPLSSRSSTGELERLQLERTRTGGGQMSRMISAIYNDAEDRTREIRNRMELARGGLINTGKVTITENRLALEADFGVPGGNFVDLTTGVPWSTVATANIVADLTTLTNSYVATNGFRPGGFWTSTKVVGYMIQNAKLANLAASVIGGTVVSQIDRPQMDSVLSRNMLPPLLGIYDTQIDVDGVDTKVLPDNKIFLVPPATSELGFTAWGISATALELVNSSSVDFSFEDAPGIVGVINREGPPFYEEVFADAVGMPVLSQPKALMVATVSA